MTPVSDKLTVNWVELALLIFIPRNAPENFAKPIFKCSKLQKGEGNVILNSKIQTKS